MMRSEVGHLFFYQNDLIIFIAIHKKNKRERKIKHFLPHTQPIENHLLLDAQPIHRVR